MVVTQIVYYSRMVTSIVTNDSGKAPSIPQLTISTRCENSLCAYKQKSKECRTIGDCVNQGSQQCTLCYIILMIITGLCQAATPCACTQEYCALPWWVQDKTTKLHCRSDKVKDHNIVLPLCNYCHDCKAAAMQLLHQHQTQCYTKYYTECKAVANATMHSMKCRTQVLTNQIKYGDHFCSAWLRL